MTSDTIASIGEHPPMPPSPLSDDELVAIGNLPIIQRIMKVVSQTTGMGFVTVAHVTPDEWTACAIHDTLDFGLAPGGKLEIETTICNEVRSADQLVAIDHVDQDPVYCGHPTPRMYGFQSYISVPIHRPDGSFFGTLCALDPQPAAVNNTRIVSMFELFADIIGEHIGTRQRLMKSEAELSAANEQAHLRDQFIAVLGHDLRNPLASLSAGMRILSAGELDARQTQAASLMRLSISRMTGLVDNILDFARGALGGGIPVRREPADDLAEALENVVEELRTVWTDNDIVSHFEIGQPVLCDKSRMEQLLSNIVSNALAHGKPEEPVRVDCTTEDGMLVLSVTNAGDPIPEHARRMLFQPFRRSKANSNAQGLGLGLFIVSEIVRAHDGTLDYVSDADATTFTVRIPAQAE